MPDSDNKRRAAGNVPGWHIIYPVPDGLIDDADRMQATGFYPLGAGAPASAVPEPEVEPAIVTLTAGGVAGRRRHITAQTREYRDLEDESVVLLLW
jgi:hypothetical protein